MKYDLTSMPPPKKMLYLVSPLYCNVWHDVAKCNCMMIEDKFLRH